MPDDGFPFFVPAHRLRPDADDSVLGRAGAGERVQMVHVGGSRQIRLCLRIPHRPAQEGANGGHEPVAVFAPGQPLGIQFKVFGMQRIDGNVDEPSGSLVPFDRVLRLPCPGKSAAKQGRHPSPHKRTPEECTARLQKRSSVEMPQSVFSRYHSCSWPSFFLTPQIPPATILEPKISPPPRRGRARVGVWIQALPPSP